MSFRHVDPDIRSAIITLARWCSTVCRDSDGQPQLCPNDAMMVMVHRGSGIPYGACPRHAEWAQDQAAGIRLVGDRGQRG